MPREEGQKRVEDMRRKTKLGGKAFNETPFIGAKEFGEVKTSKEETLLASILASSSVPPQTCSVH